MRCAETVEGVACLKMRGVELQDWSCVVISDKPGLLVEPLREVA